MASKRLSLAISSRRVGLIALLLTPCLAFAARQGSTISLRGFRGLNDHEIQTNIADNESPSCKNVRFPLGSLKKRDGHTERRDGVLPNGANAVQSLDEGVISGTRYLLATVNGSITYDDGAAWVDITGTPSPAISTSATANICAATHKDLFIFSDDENDIWKWTGTGNIGTLTIATTTSAKAMAVYYDRLVLGNVVESGTRYYMRVRWSDIGAPEGWTSANFNTLIDSSGDQIMSLVPAGDFLYIMARRSIWLMDLTGISAAPFSFKIISPQRGVVSSDGTVVIDNVVYFASDDGIYAFHARSPTRIELVSRNVHNTYGSRNRARDASVKVLNNGKHGELWIAYSGSGSSTNNRVLVLSYEDAWWSVFEGIAANAFGKFEGSAGTEYVFGAYDGEVHTLNSTRSDDGVAINSEYYSKWLDAGDSIINKRIKEIQLEALRKPQSDDITISYAYDGRGYTDTQSLLYDISITGSAFGTAKFDVDKFSTDDGEPIFVSKPAINSGRYFQVRVGESIAGTEFSLFGISLRLIGEE